MGKAKPTGTPFYVIPLEGSEEYTLLIAFCENNRTAVLASMPWVAGELVECGLGFRGLFKYVRRHGGNLVKIDLKNGWFTKEFGPEKRDRLLKMGDGVLYVPSANSLISSLRNVAIDNAIKEKTSSLAAIARKFGITTRSVRSRRSQLRMNNPEVT